MELANGKTNKFFSNEDENKYWLNDFDVIETQGKNNVLMFIDEISRESSVLDIGCAYGRIGKELKKKECIVYGIDKDMVAAKMAINNNGYRDVFLFDMDDTSHSEFLRMENSISKVDTIIFSDVFEHLVDPTKILLQYAKYLKKGGNILISVPNIAHIDIILHLMDGEFNYNDMGILDNTHLKFFTKNSFAQWIDLINKNYRDIKFDCEFLGATFYDNSYMETVKTKYTNLFNILSQNSNYNGLQILFKLKVIDELDNSNNLNDLLIEKDIKLTDLLGNILEEKEISVDLFPNIGQGEKLWLQQHIKQLEQGIEWHHKQDIERQAYVDTMQKYIEEQKQGIEWYQMQDAERQAYVDTMQKYIEEQKQGLEWHQNQDVEHQVYVETLDKLIEEQKQGLEWYQNQDVERQIYVEALEKQIKEQRQGLEWHQKQDIERQVYVETLETHIEEQKQGLEWHQRNDAEHLEYRKKLEKNLEIERIKQNDLQAKIFTMENSLSWKITKLLRRKSGGNKK